MKSISTIFIAVIFLCVIGCGGDPRGRLPLDGTITFKGEPLDKGTIDFLSNDPNQPLSARTMIQDGKFKVPAEQGLPPGTYRVVISSPEPSKGPPLGPPEMKLPPPGVERIPAKYNRDSRETVTVSREKANTFHFAIE